MMEVSSVDLVWDNEIVKLSLIFLEAISKEIFGTKEKNIKIKETEEISYHII